MGKAQLKRKNEKGKSEESRIPLCRTEFLQDVTIALGRRSLKWIRRSRTLTFEVSEESMEDASLERLEIEARGFGWELTKVVLWENAHSFMYRRERKPTPDKPAIEVHAELASLSAEEIADLIRATLNGAVLVETAWRKLAALKR